MTNAAVTCFGFEDHLVRVIMRGEDPWFVAMDVCRVLGIQNPGRAADRLDEDEKGIHSTYTLGGEQQVSVVSESGLYTLILRCRSATTPGSPAHRFRRWVTGEVLPQIRKTGQYARPEAAAAAADAGRTLAEERLKLDKIHYVLRGFGPAAMRMLWRELGLDWVPEMDVAMRATVTGDMHALSFCETRLERRPGVMTPFQTIYSAYRDWCSAKGIVPVGDNAFGKLMSRLGHEKVKASRIYYRGVALKPAEAAQDA